MIPCTSMFASNEKQLKEIRRNTVVRFILAASFPFGALGLQLAFWSVLAPFFWFAFFPAVFLSSWIAGVFGGILSTVLSVTLCWYYFMPPERTFAAVDIKYFITSVGFFMVGILISILTGRLRKIIKEQKQEQIESHRREVQLKEAQRISSFGSWSWDIKNNCIDWTEETYRIFGLEPEQFTITPEAYLNFIHPQDRGYVSAKVEAAIANGKSYSIDYRIICPDGKEKIVHSAAEVYLNGNGDPIEMIGTIHDVTDRKKYEESLKESESKFRGLLETACDPIIIVNAKGFIEFANRRVKESLGYEPTELLGQPVETIVPNRFCSSHLVERIAYMTQPNPRPMGRNLQLSAKRKDGGELPVDISLSPFNTSRGVIVTAFMRDMSERKRHEAQQRFLYDTTRMLSETMDYQERIRLIANLVVPPLADFCLVHILENNQLVLKASSQREFIDPNFLHQIFSNETFKASSSTFAPYLIAALEGDQLLSKIDDKFLSGMAGNDKDLFDKIKTLNIQSSMSVPMLTRGRKIGVISFFRCKPTGYTRSDLEFAKLVADRAAMAVDNAKLYREARSAVKLREDVLAVVSHDLRNPLGVIKGFNEAIADKLISSDASKSDLEATEAIARSVRQMERLINDLLDFAKIESGTLSVDINPNRVDHLIWSGIEAVRHHLDKKAIRVKIEIEPSATEINCDPDRIQQVFSNLLGNAVKFTPEYGTITIRSEIKESEVIFSVSDSGPGISPENLPHVFNRYWQAKGTAKLGIGLGLSIAKGIVESHHGRIWVESIMGEGTTFYFSMPIEAATCDYGIHNNGWRPSENFDRSSFVAGSQEK